MHTTYKTPAKDALLLIESGLALKLVRESIAEYSRVAREVAALSKELGVQRGTTDITKGVLLGVVFQGEVHADFRKPDRRGVSYPRKGSNWHRRFEEQKGYASQASVIAAAFGVPLTINYKDVSRSGDSFEGSRCIGSPLNECGFLWISKDGPFAMWVPDVEAIVAAEVAQGRTVEEPAASFKLSIDGCRRIRQEEWEIMVLQDKLKKAA